MSSERELTAQLHGTAIKCTVADFRLENQDVAVEERA